jgi:hypothetical protein
MCNHPLIFCKIMTFVLFGLVTSTADTLPLQTPYQKNTATQPKPELQQPSTNDIDANNLMLAPLESPKENPSSESEVQNDYRYRQSLTPILGLVGSTDADHRLEYNIGFRYLWPRFYQPQAELGVELLSEFGGHALFGVKRTFFDRTLYRPFYLYGISHEFVPKERIATVTTYKNYYLRGSIGFEDTLKMPKSIRVELEARLGIERQMILLNFGYSWGF